MRSIQAILHADFAELADAEIDIAVAALASATIAVERLGDRYLRVAQRLHDDIERFSDERVRRRAKS